VVTKKDTPAGRNMQVHKSAVKILIEKYNLENEKNIPILQPEKLKDIKEQIKEINPELIVVIAYGKILSSEILNIPKYGCVNVHASLLPKYRGASCVPAPILNGDELSGITIMKMDEGMDTGPIIKKLEIKLGDDKTSASLMEKIIKLSEESLVPTLMEYLEGNIKPQEQDESSATYVKMIKKEDGRLDFKNEKAEVIERKVRAYYPWPGTYAFIEKDDSKGSPKNKLLFKIQKSEQEFLEAPQKLPGEVFIENGVLWIKAKDLAISPTIVQLEGKKALSSADFIKGNSWIVGKILE
jgi:methionyl-tRNA formyltransferase